MKQDFYTKVQQIDDALSSEVVDADYSKLLISLIYKDENLCNYFFARAKSAGWFIPLKEKGYFKPRTITFNEEGFALFWNVLDYLERVSEQIPQGLQYGRELIEIIDSVIQFSLNKKRINSYHIWWYCVKIFNNLPSKIIQDNLNVDKFRVWLTVWTEHSMGVDLTISDVGEKLLPKFFHDDYGAEYKYAELIIEVITQVKAGGKIRGIAKGKDASLTWDSYWIRDSFKKHAKLIGQKCSLRCIFRIATRLKDVLEYKQKNHYVNIETDKDVYQIWVSRVEKEGLRKGDIGYKYAVYECAVKKYEEEQLKKIDRKNDFWALYNTEPKIEVNIPFSFRAKNKDNMASTIKEYLPNAINWTNDKKFQKKLEGIFDGLHADYSHIWFRSLASGGRDHASGAGEVLTTILRDVLLEKCKVNREEGKKVLEEFLSDKYQFPIFKRFVLLCIDVFWKDYAPFFNKLIQIIPSILEESDLEVEIQDVLLRHNSQFSTALKSKLKKLISNVPKDYIEKGDKSVAYWRYKWFSPLKDNRDFVELYEKAKVKANPKDGKPYKPDKQELGFTRVIHKSPISKEDILKKPIAEILKDLSEFKGADSWHGAFEGEPDKEGLASVLQVAVKDEPRKFTDELDAFMKLDYFYLHRIFRGLKDTWNAGAEIDWQNIFDFSIKYLDRDKDLIIGEALKAQGKDSGQGRYIWILESIVELIGDGSRDDKRAFDQQYFEKVEQIFDLILPLLKGEDHPETQRDALTYALNTTLGRTIMAYVAFSLRVARATQKKKENWGRDNFERFLPIGIDGYIWFGSYLPQMKYLDNNYTIEKISYFSKKDPSDFQWRMFMEGYLMRAQIYKDLYYLMRKNYYKGLESKVFEKRGEQKLVEHICVGYLNIGELLQLKNSDKSGSLFWKMLTEAGKLGKYDRWLHVVNFFWSVTRRTTRKEEKASEDKLSKESRTKILEFWRWAFNNPDIVKDNLGEEYNSFLGKIAELTILLDKIDEEKEGWLLQSAPHIDCFHNAAFFIEYLAKFKDPESIKRIGKIYKKVLEDTTPTYSQEDIELIICRIYEKGNYNDAEAICNTYGRRGIHFLKPVWAKYHK